MFNFSFFIDYYSEYLNEYSFSLILFNVIIYTVMLINIFLIFFLFDVKYIRTLNELNFLNNLPFISIFLILLLLSFAGIPPLLGFLNKFLVFIYIFSKNNVMLLFFFLFINIFIIYFYIQNLRFLISKNNKNKYFFKNKNIYLNENLIFFINFINFFNVFGIFYFEELIILLNFITSCLNF